MARPTAGGSGTKTTLPPFPRTRRTRCPCSSSKVADVRADLRPAGKISRLEVIAVNLDATGS
jgi:hypothetical protein